MSSSISFFCSESRSCRTRSRPSCGSRAARDAIILYFGDFALVFAALATLRWRALLQRRGDPDTELRLREWRATVRQYTIVLVLVGCLVAMGVGVIPKENFYSTVPAVFVAVTVLARFAVRRLPGFLQ